MWPQGSDTAAIQTYIQLDLLCAATEHSNLPKSVATYVYSIRSAHPVCSRWFVCVASPAADHSVAAVFVPVLLGVDSRRHNDW